MRKNTLTVQETADYLGVSRDTIYNMVRTKEIPHFRIRRRIFFSRDTIDKWILQQEHEILDEAIS